MLQKKAGIRFLSGILILAFYVSVQRSFSYMVVGTYIPMLVHSEDAQIPAAEKWMGRFMKNFFPLLAYADKSFYLSTIVEDEHTYEQLLKLEGTDEDMEQDAEQQEEPLFISPDTREKAEQELQAGRERKITENFQALLHSKKQRVYKPEEMDTFEKLIGEFYAVDSTTFTSEAQLNPGTLENQDMTLHTPADKPQILIYHTHGSEGYVNSVPGDLSTTVVGVGENLKRILTKTYGYNVIHDSGIYDTVREQAYTVAAPYVEKNLEENPSIEVVIDLHRDQMPEDKKLLAEIGGNQMAKFMFFNGLSRTKTTGDIAYLKNPYIQENLSFAFQMQKACNEYYPGLTRKIYLKGYRYNMHYRGKTLLVELGAQTNTVEEAMNACYPLARMLHCVLSGEETQ